MALLAYSLLSAQCYLPYNPPGDKISQHSQEGWLKFTDPAKQKIEWLQKAQ